MDVLERLLFDLQSSDRKTALAFDVEVDVQQPCGIWAWMEFDALMNGHAKAMMIDNSLIYQ